MYTKSPTQCPYWMKFAVCACVHVRISGCFNDAPMFHSKEYQCYPTSIDYHTVHVLSIGYTVAGMDIRCTVYTLQGSTGHHSHRREYSLCNHSQCFQRALRKHSPSVSTKEPCFSHLLKSQQLCSARLFEVLDMLAETGGDVGK